MLHTFKHVEPTIVPEESGGAVSGVGAAVGAVVVLGAVVLVGKVAVRGTPERVGLRAGGETQRGQAQRRRKPERRSSSLVHLDLLR